MAYHFGTHRYSGKESRKQNADNRRFHNRLLTFTLGLRLLQGNPRWYAAPFLKLLLKLYSETPDRIYKKTIRANNATTSLAASLWVNVAYANNSTLPFA